MMWKILTKYMKIEIVQIHKYKYPLNFSFSLKHAWYNSAHHVLYFKEYTKKCLHKIGINPHSFMLCIWIWYAECFWTAALQQRWSVLIHGLLFLYQKGECKIYLFSASSLWEPCSIKGRVTLLVQSQWKRIDHMMHCSQTECCVLITPS